MPLIDSYLLDNYLIDGPELNSPWKLIGSGTVTSSNASLGGNGFDTQGSAASNYYVNVGFAFPVMPKLIIVKTASGSTQCIANPEIKNQFGNSVCFTVGSGGMFLAMSTTSMSSSFYVTLTGLRLPTAFSNTSHTWEAYV